MGSLKAISPRVKLPVSKTKLPFVLTAVSQVISETTAYNKIPLITVLHCNFYLALKF